MMVCARCYCDLLCCVCLMSLGGLLFTEEKQRGCGSGGKGRWEGEAEEGRGGAGGETVVGI